MSNTQLPSFSEVLECLDRYKKAVQREIDFFKQHGGRQYQITNGRFITFFKGLYAYAFDFDSELVIQEDLPIHFFIRGLPLIGKVLSHTENNLVVGIPNYIAPTILFASISIDPWKLSEALIEKLNAFSPDDKIAVKLIQEGPSLTRQTPLEQIAMGQESAIAHAKKNPITVIWGPPGTGKTHTIANIAIHYLQSGMRVLLVSQSNVSVDGMTLKIGELLNQSSQQNRLKQGNVLRYGFTRTEELKNDKYLTSINYTLSHHPDLRERLDKLRKTQRILRKSLLQDSREYLENERAICDIYSSIENSEKQYIRNAKIVLSTISKVQIDPLFAGVKYDAVIFDEVSMAYIPQVFFSAMLATKHLIVVVKQLAPIVQSSDEDGILSKDIFSFLKIDKDGITNHKWLVMLDTQRRMHPDISHFSNVMFYRNLLKDYPNMRKQREPIVQRLPMIGCPINLIDIQGIYASAAKNKDNSRFNILNAIISFGVAAVTELRGESSIGIITPYAAQAKLIRAMIRDYQISQKKRGEEPSKIACATVHQFQGSERNVIIFDTVENHPLSKLGWLTSQNDNYALDRLVNVAMTRTRGKFYAVANHSFMKQQNEYGGNSLFDLIDYLHNNGKEISVQRNNLSMFISALHNYLKRPISGVPSPSLIGNHIAVYQNKADALPLLLKDIESAEISVLVLLPDTKFDEETGTTVLRALAKAVKRKVRINALTNNSELLPSHWRLIASIGENISFPLIFIDDKKLWYGIPAPLSGYQVKTDTNQMLIFGNSLPLVISIKGENTIAAIKNELNFNAKSVGLGIYVNQNASCPLCQSAMQLKLGRSGRAYIQCPSCGEKEYLTKNLVEDYIYENDITCPVHKCSLHAEVSQYGLYVRCIEGHTVKLHEI